jgi:signal transduction histidine kinase
LTSDQRERLRRLEQVGQMALGLTHDFKNTAICLLDELARLEDRLQQLRQHVLRLPDPAATVATLAACDRAVAQIADGLAAAIGHVREVQALYRSDPRPAPGGADLAGPELARERGRFRDSLLAEAARRALALLGGRVRVLAQVPGREPIRVAVDGSILVRVLTNLLLNALDAFPSDAPTPRIRLQMRVADRQAICDVCDNGPGVTPEIRGRLFQPFATSKAGTGGTGLGLALSRDLIRAQGGELELLETGPAGTVFRLSLPLAQVEGDPDRKTRPIEELIAAVLPPARPTDRPLHFHVVYPR